MNPKVSLVIPIHDGSNHLEQTLESLLSQTYDNFEIIVVDNDSSERGTISEVLERYGDKITFYKKKSSILAETINYGIKKSNGQYFSWLSQGDTYTPDRLESMVKLVGKNGNEIIISNWESINQNGRTVRSFKVDTRLEKHPGCWMAFEFEARLNTCAMLIPIELLRAAGSFDDSLPPHLDYKMLGRLISAGVGFKSCQRPLFKYGQHPRQESLVGPLSDYTYDFLHSEVIGSLDYQGVTDFFGDAESVLEQYRRVLEAGFPRFAAFLMDKIIRGSIAYGTRNVASDILLDQLSGLSEDRMATSADKLITKCAKPSAKKKIMFSSAHWLTGGMERVMSTLFMELKDSYEIFLITPYDDRKSKIDIPDFVTSIKINDDLFRKHFDSIILSYAMLMDIDVVIGFINLFEKQQNLYNLCVGTKIKTIASNHEYYFYPYKSPAHYDVVEKRLSAYGNCDAIVWANNFNAALCDMYVQNNYVIGNPNNFEVSEAENDTPKGNTIIAVGRFNDYVKRIDRILECFSLVLKTTPDANLVLVGKYNYDEPVRPHSKTTLRDLIGNLAIPSDTLNFVGEVDNVEDYYKSAKVLLLTSNSEGFGMVLNEAACFGVPSVCNYIPGIEDIITDGVNGFITEQDDIESMASRICEVLDNDRLQKELSNNAKRMVSLFDSRHIGVKWRLLIDGVITIQTKEKLHRSLDGTIGFKKPDPVLLSSVLSREINEIFYQTITERVNPDMGNTLLMLSKLKTMPARLKANIEYEGIYDTGKKVAMRSYMIIKNKVIKK